MQYNNDETFTNAKTNYTKQQISWLVKINTIIFYSSLLKLENQICKNYLQLENIFVSLRSKKTLTQKRAKWDMEYTVPET